jgi:hypothetical protein
MYSTVALFVAGSLLATSSVPPAGAAYRRVRGADRTAEEAIARAVASSAIVRDLVAQLEQSDLVVYVHIVPFMSGADARTTFLSANAGVRYLRVSLHPSAQGREQIILLGHELQHAREIAAAKEVRDRWTFRALYRRIGLRRLAETAFETAAAIEIATAIRQELAGRSPEPTSVAEMGV